MATKDKLLEYIVANFISEGQPITKSAIDGYTKAELEEFLQNQGKMEEAENWSN